MVLSRFLHRFVAMDSRDMGVRAALLDECLGVGPDNLEKLFFKEPQLLTGPVVEQQLRSALDFMKDEVCLTQAAICRIVSEAPTVLGLDVARQLRPKWSYLLKVMGPELDISTQVVGFPGLLEAGLTEIIVPRLEFSRARHHWPVTDLKAILGSTDTEFLALVGGTHAQYNNYRRSIQTKVKLGQRSHDIA
eukprot:TRINITY_DN13619_c0_g1_i4.p1 TRINITY_DN13619_c0_g1~~TRINITY_DN13619_c0_g1_i4.p1  ORF type:complete len:191 (+),score=18.61 TRINITY_DN13619_c0_g1_i4:188-760(+)